MVLTPTPDGKGIAVRCDPGFPNAWPSSLSTTTLRSKAGPIERRPGFAAMLDRIAGNGVRVILVESPDRFAREEARR